MEQIAAYEEEMLHPIMNFEEYQLDIKGLSSYDVADLLDINNLEVSRMKGSAMILPTVFDVPNTEKKNRVHQAEKPIELFRQLLEYITLKG